MSYAEVVDPRGVPGLTFEDWYPRSPVRPTRPDGFPTDYWGPWEVWPFMVQVVKDDGSISGVSVGLYQVCNMDEVPLIGMRAVRVMGTDESLVDAERFCFRRNAPRKTRVVVGAGFYESALSWATWSFSTSNPMTVAEAVLREMSKHDDVAKWIL